MSLFESYMNRHQRGGFLVGDIFKFNSNFKSTPEYKEMGDNTKEVLDTLSTTDLYVIVTGIRDKDGGARFPGNPQTASGEVILDIALDQGGGRYSDHCAVPVCFGEPDDSYGSGPKPTPASRVRDDKVNIKPKPVDEAEEENPSNLSDRGDGKLKRTEIDNAKKNTKLKSKPATKSPTDKNAYVADYLQGIEN